MRRPIFAISAILFAACTAEGQQATATHVDAEAITGRESPARAASPCVDCALDCPASHPKAGHRHEPVVLRKAPPPPRRRLERAKSFCPPSLSS